MNRPEFVTLIDEVMCRTSDTLIRKNASYNPGHDVLAHFKEDTVDFQEIAARLFGYADKHWLKIKLLKRVHPDSKPLEEWQESLDDIKNYLILLEALLVDFLREGD